MHGGVVGRRVCGRNGRRERVRTWICMYNKKKVSFFPFKKINKGNKRIRLNIYLLCNSVRTMCTEINLSTTLYINLYPLN